MRRSACRPRGWSWTALVTLVFATSRASAQPVPLAQLIRSEILPNGMTVIVVENHAIPLATAHVVFRGGAMTQTPDLQGVPHLFEHMLFKSFKGTDDASFDREAQSAGASFNGATGDEEVSYTMWFPSDQFGTVANLLADLVREPKFRDKDMITERFVVRNEMQRNQSDPEFLLSTAIRQALWGDWFPRKNTIGNDLSLFSANAARLTSLYETWYVPNNAALIVTGDVRADKVFGEARKHFGRWQTRPDPLTANPIPTPAPLYTHNVQTITVQMSWRGPTLRDDKSGTLDADAMADLLNADDSPFQRALVDAGHFQSASVGVNSMQHAGEILFRGTTTPDRLMVALGALGDEIRKLSDSSYYDGTALRASVQQRRVHRALAFEETSSLASTIGTYWAVTGMDYYLKYDEMMAARTPATISAIVARYVTNKPYVIGLLTPVESQAMASNVAAQFVAFMREP
jgi:zinc protease